MAAGVAVVRGVDVAVEEAVAGAAVAGDGAHEKGMGKEIYEMNARAIMTEQYVSAQSEKRNSRTVRRQQETVRGFIAGLRRSKEAVIIQVSCSEDRYRPSTLAALSSDEGLVRETPQEGKSRIIGVWVGWVWEFSGIPNVYQRARLRGDMKSKTTKTTNQFTCGKNVHVIFISLVTTHGIATLLIKPVICMLHVTSRYLDLPRRECQALVHVGLTCIFSLKTATF